MLGDRVDAGPCVAFQGPYRGVAGAGQQHRRGRGVLRFVCQRTVPEPVKAHCAGAGEGEGTQNLLCTYLAAAVLAGPLTNALFGLWWLDPVVGLFVAGLAVREGGESRRGEERGC
jgi:hypothetical protein